MGLLGKQLFIAEVKTKSPFNYISERSFEELFALANRVGDMLSIHTDPRWGGSFYNLSRARQWTNKPLLAKGIHENDDEIRRALDCGADSVLVVGRMPHVFLRDHCYVEPLDLAQLAQFNEEAPHMVWNSRDLCTGGQKTETFTQARQRYNGQLVQASNISSVEDIDPTADGVIAGEHLPEFAQELIG